MDELDFVISASGAFGNLMWEYPDEIKDMLLEFQKAPGGEEIVRDIMEAQKQDILSFLHIQCAVLHAGPLAPVFAANVNKHLRELTKEGFKLFHSR
jgi:hypothetical protein